MATLFPELLDAIVDQVNDTESLKAWSLVAPRFLAPSQRRLFHSIRVPPLQVGTSDTIASEHPTESLNSFLTASPHIASYILELRAHGSPDPANHALAVTLRALPNLLRLVLHRLFWQLIPTTLRTALTDMIAQSSLLQLHMHIVHGLPPALVLQAASSVSVLTINNASVDRSAELPVPSTSTPSARLSHLTISASQSHFCGILLLAPACLATLEVLQVNADPERITLLEQLLHVVAPTLLHLTLLNGDIPVELPSMPRVRTAELKFFIRSGDSPLALLLPPLVRLTHALPNVQSIAADLVFISDAHDLGAPAHLPGTTQLVAFPQLGKVPHLHRVVCRLRGVDFAWADDAVQRFYVALADTLTDLRARDISSLYIRSTHWTPTDDFPDSATLPPEGEMSQKSAKNMVFLLRQFGLTETSGEAAHSIPMRPVPREAVISTHQTRDVVRQKITLSVLQKETAVIFEDMALNRVEYYNKDFSLYDSSSDY
ncbi:hypothetical protein C8J57DRAFT_1480918, partial [Mycena rebaudengoi]